MDIGKFIGKVREMRKCQREYFRWRSAGWLERAKNAEREVDADLNEYYQDLQQPKLF